MAALFVKNTLPSYMYKKEHKECLSLLQDINLVEDVLAYDYYHFAIVHPNVEYDIYALLKQIVNGTYSKFEVLFLKYIYHDYGNNSDGYKDIFRGCKYERFDTDSNDVSWKSYDKRSFKTDTVLYSFKGRKFETCDVVTSLCEDECTCIARRNVIFNKNFASNCL